MRFSNSSGAVILLSVTVLLVTVIGGVVFALVSYSPSLSDEKKYIELQRFQASAGVYFTRLGFFDGLCDDIGVPAVFTCNESADAFAIEVPLKSGGFYCTDSTGFLGEVLNSLKKKTDCSK